MLRAVPSCWAMSMPPTQLCLSRSHGVMIRVRFMHNDVLGCFEDMRMGRLEQSTLA
jgi:hypothetical protein